MGLKKKMNQHFFFSLNKKKEINIKNDQIEKAIYGNNSYFAFAYSYNLKIYDKSMSNNDSYCNSNSYNTEQCELNCDEKNFSVDELEVNNVEFE